MKILRLLWEMILPWEIVWPLEAEITSNTGSRLVGFNTNAFMRAIYGQEEASES